MNDLQVVLGSASCLSVTAAEVNLNFGDSTPSVLLSV